MTRSDPPAARREVRNTPAMDCLLCRIVARTEEASIVYEDDRVVALCDLHPVNPGHLFLADGEAAFQDVFHVHLHVIPRDLRDGFRLDSGQSSTPTARRELDAIAAEVSGRL